MFQNFCVSKKFRFQKIWLPKNAGFQNLLSLKNFKLQKNFVSKKKLGPNKIWVLINFGLSKNFGSDKKEVQKHFASKIFWLHKKLGSPKILSPKNNGPRKKFWFKKICINKNYWFKKIWVPKYWVLEKILVPKKNWI